ncbi:MAG TPA: hypothetical protein VIF60_25010 [Burkholderiaceae bacterium]
MTATPALASGLASTFSAAFTGVGALTFFGSDFLVVTGAFDGAATGLSVAFAAGLATCLSLLGVPALAVFAGTALGLALGAGLAATLVVLVDFALGTAFADAGAGLAAALTIGLAAGLTSTFAAGLTAGFDTAVFFAGIVGVFTGFFIAFAMESTSN